MVKQKLQQTFFQVENYGKKLQSLCSNIHSLWSSYL